MKEFGEIANLETVLSKEEPLRKRLIIFNHVNTNGRIYIAKSKEEIQKLLYKNSYLTSDLDENVDTINTNDISKISEQFKDNEIQNLLYKDLYLTSGLDENVDINDSCIVDISKIIGIFKDIEIIETEDIGIDDLPIFEVYGKLQFFDTPSKEFHKNCFDANIVTIGLRSIVKHISDKIVNIKQIICWDTIVR